MAHSKVNIVVPVACMRYAVKHFCAPMHAVMLVTARDAGHLGLVISLDD